MSSRLSALVLDLDGVVADTEPASLAAVAEVFATAGVTLDERELRELVGIEFGRLEPILRARHGIPADGRDLRLDYDRTYVAKLAAGIEPNPGVRELLAAARAAGVPVAVASSSPLDQVERVLEATGVRAAIDVVAAGSEVERTKPAPDVYALALDRLGLSAAAAVAVEDSAPGIAAARAAGLVCVGLRTTATASHDFGAASAVVTSLSELSLARLEALVVDGVTGEG